jgi:murein DD-endopeptidase MepM/ murein hydrolase activator NlpD
MDRPRTMQRDFKSQATESAFSPRITHHHLLTLAGILLGVGIIIGFAPHSAEATRGEAVSVPGPAFPDAADEGTVASLEHPAGETPAPAAVNPVAAPLGQAPADGDDNWRTVTIKPGDSLSLIFGRNGLSARELHEIMSLGKETRALTRIFPGKEIRFLVDGEGRLEALGYDVSESQVLEVRRGDNGFVAHTIEHEIEIRLAQAGGTISDSLFMTASRAGLSDNLTMELAGIFGWDIDFSLDIRENDRFSVIYEQQYLHGEKLRDGRILAAEFVNRGKVHRAIRYTDADNRSDYFNPNGDSMRKAFLRSPVDFTRVSSRFNLNRRHPILNTIRAHRGVDYAAPTGTPIRATGDGRIVSLGTNGGYGKTIVVQHGSRYSTLYAHLSGYARGLRAGHSVRQGQVIGYVGMTGLATGPHLHYEFQVDGVHRDPLRVKLPDASPLAAKYMDDFRSYSAPFLAQLDVIEHMHASLQETNGTQILDAGPVALFAPQ